MKAIIWMHYTPLASAKFPTKFNFNKLKFVIIKARLMVRFIVKLTMVILFDILSFFSYNITR